MRIVPAVVAFASAACLGLAAHAQTQLTVTGDFDGDGKPDTVERRIHANGVWQVIATLSSQPDTALRIIEGDEPGQGSEPIVVTPPGEYDVLFQGADGPRVFTADAFLLERGPYGRRLVFWHEGALKSAWLKVPD